MSDDCFTLQSIGKCSFGVNCTLILELISLSLLTHTHTHTQTHKHTIPPRTCAARYLYLSAGIELALALFHNFLYFALGKISYLRIRFPLWCRHLQHLLKILNSFIPFSLYNETPYRKLVYNMWHKSHNGHLDIIQTL